MPDAYIYINYATGERIASRAMDPAQNHARGTSWSWSARAMDPIADPAEPYGVLDLADIGRFVTLFQSECVF